MSPSPSSEEAPELSVIVASFNRADRAAEAVASVAALGLPSVQVVVVDDGSDGAAASRLDELAGEFDVLVIHQANLGLSGARVRGAAEATGRWLAFLDDDDSLLDGWRSILHQMDPANGWISGPAEIVRPDGTPVELLRPRPQGPIFHDATANYLAGCFAVRRDVYDAAGGYLPGLTGSEQTELFIRCAAVCVERSLGIVTVDQPVARIERRAATDRQLSNPRLSFAGTRWILARHADRFALDPAERSNWEGIAALNAVRLNDPAARAHAVRSVRFAPTDLRAWARLVAVASPLAARRWGHVDRYLPTTAAQRSPLRHAATFRGTATAALCAESDHFFLPWRYQENPPTSTDSESSTFWEGGTAENDVRYQQAVYRWAAKLVADGRPNVVDIGCGSGHKLVQRIAPVTDNWLGVDQGSAIRLASTEFPAGHWLEADLSEDSVWQGLKLRAPDLVICSDVIEHLPDPLQLLERLRDLAGANGSVLVSTPDRARLEGRDRFGPPFNHRHIREWSAEEFRLLIEAAGLRVIRARHFLPRSYSATGTDIRRTVYRALHGRPIPDPRSSMAFLLSSDIADNEPV